MCNNILLTDLLGNQHLFEILQTSPTFKNSENMKKMIVSKKICDGDHSIFFRNKGGI